ncbi:MAG: hypothetical protein PHR32_05430 [Candidatus Cloacimonetes bacterium]|nr:hypothetical protein [Candidatus Cloacimonadota bacterium]
MKRYILLVVLYLFMAALMAQQTGLFDLNYNQSMKAAHAALLAKGFEETGRLILTVTYKNDKIPGLIDLELRDMFEVGLISSWAIRYNVKDNPELISKLRSDLKALHKKELLQSDSNGVWTWDLGSSYGLSMILSDDKATLKLEYTDDDETNWLEMQMSEW